MSENLLCEIQMCRHVRTLGSMVVLGGMLGCLALGEAMM